MCPGIDEVADGIGRRSHSKRDREDILHTRLLLEGIGLEDDVHIFAVVLDTPHGDPVHTRGDRLIDHGGRDIVECEEIFFEAKYELPRSILR